MIGGFWIQGFTPNPSLEAGAWGPIRCPRLQAGVGESGRQRRTGLHGQAGPFPQEIIAPACNIATSIASI